MTLERPFKRKRLNGSNAHDLDSDNLLVNLTDDDLLALAESDDISVQELSKKTTTSHHYTSQRTHQNEKKPCKNRGHDHDSDDMERQKRREQKVIKRKTQRPVNHNPKCQTRNTVPEWTSHSTGSNSNNPTKISVANRVEFKALCSLFEQTCTDKGRSRMDRFGKFFRQIEQFRNKHNLAMDYFAFMRLILPQLDFRRRYGVKESRLARGYIKFLAIDKQSSDARALEKWKNPQLNAHGHSANRGQSICFSDTVFNILIRRNLTSSSNSPSISNINMLLDRLSQGSDQSKEDFIKEIALKLSAVEQKWLIRIILKDMKISVRHNTILSHFHEHALDLLCATSDLELVCQKCCPGRTFHFDIKQAITLFKPLKPMLASNIKDLDSQLQRLLSEGNYCIEPKYDGERMMIHKKGQTVRYFSRRGVEFTFYYKQFSPLVLQHIKAQNCIIDGEMMVWNREKKAFNEFGNNRTLGANWGRKEFSSENENFCYICFDAIMLNDSVILEKAYEERRHVLKSFVEPVEHYLEIVRQDPVSTRESVFSELDKAIDNTDEGIIIKDMGSVYELDKRNESWIKVKPDHFFRGEHFMGETFDLLIVGAYYGTKFGRRSLSHFLCALSVPGRDDLFHSFCKIGSGYTRDELSRLQLDTQAHWIEYRRDLDVPMFDGWVPQAGEIPDVVIDDPRNGLVVEVLAADIIESDKFRVNRTLRFPRMKRRRDDKNWKTCDSLDRLEDLISSNRAGRYRHRQDTMNSMCLSGTTDQVNNSKSSTRKSQAPTILNAFALTNTSDVACETRLFSGWEFCIFSGDDKKPQYDKRALETEIARHKGTFVANPGPSTKCIIAGNHANIKVRNWCREKNNMDKDRDIVHYQWLLDCIKQNRIIPLHPHFMIYTTKKTLDRFKFEIDRYGDSHTEDVTTAQLVEIFQNVKKSGKFERASNEQVNRMSSRYDVIRNEFQSLFMHSVRAYVDMYKVVGDENQLIESSPLVFDDIRLRLYSGSRIDRIDKQSDLTHVVVDPGDLTRLDDIVSLLKRCRMSPIITSNEWVKKCFDTRTLVKEDKFVISPFDDGDDVAALSLDHLSSPCDISSMNLLSI